MKPTNIWEATFPAVTAAVGQRVELDGQPSSTTRWAFTAEGVGP